MDYSGADRIDAFFAHHGIKGQKWGIRRFQNEDGSLTELGKKHYGRDYNKKGELTRKAQKADEKFKKAISDAYSAKRIRTVNKYIAKAEKDPANKKRIRKYLRKSGELAKRIQDDLDAASDEYTKKHGFSRYDSVIDSVMEERKRTNVNNASEFDKAGSNIKNDYKKRVEKRNTNEVLYNRKTTQQEKDEIFNYASERVKDKDIKNYLSSGYVPAGLKGIINGLANAKSKAEVDKQVRKFDKLLDDDEFRFVVKNDPVYAKAHGSYGKDGVVDAVLDYRSRNDVYDFQDKIVDLIQTKRKDFK